jgi:CRP-like cAMP-binding protein
MKKGSRELRQEWERRLSAYGLSQKECNRQGLQDINHPALPDSFQPFASDSELGGIPWRKRAQTRNSLDWTDVQKMQKVRRVITNVRAIPSWAMSPDKCRQLLDWISPKWRTHPVQRRCAARDAALIRLSLCMCLSHEEVAETLGYCKANIGMQLQRLEKLATQFFSYPAGTAPPYRTGQGGRRTFSHEEALRLRESGMTFKDIAAKLGVRGKAVAQAVRKMKREAA